jgi:Tfp pilus assembly protein PilO
MDKQVLALLIPILALAIPVAGIVFHGLEKMARMRLEETRLRTGGSERKGAAEITALRDDIADLRHDLGEVQERLDFAERVLSQAREVERLPGRGVS